MKKASRICTLLIVLLTLALPLPAFASEVMTTKHLFKKGSPLNLEIRTCDNGMHPIVLAYHADPAKLVGPTIPFKEELQLDNTRKYFAVVEEDTEGMVSQFCDFKEIKPFFDKLKQSTTEPHALAK